MDLAKKKSPKAPVPLPAVDELVALLNYDPSSGVFTWKVDKFPARAGEVAGTVSDACGYRSITINGGRYRASRLAWKVFYGTDPSGLVDHRDGDTTNDRIDNLRDVTESQNRMNTKRRHDNKSGAAGVTWCNTKGRWVARITVNWKVTHLGNFRRVEDAIAARQRAQARMFGEFARAA